MASGFFTSRPDTGPGASMAARFIVLQAGQSLAIEGDRVAALVVVEGEAIVQEPARWIAGQVVLPRARRLVAPSPWRAEGSVSVLAVGRVKLLVQDRPRIGRWIAAAVCAVAEWVRLSRRRSSPVRRPSPLLPARST